MPKLFSTFIIILYTIVFSTSLFVFYIFKPFTYLDNAQSKIICNKNGAVFEIGWNFVYSFDGKLDAWNDIKARKICEYNAIKDYVNAVKTPQEVNYHFEPIYITESSWPDAIFMFVSTLIVGIIIAEIVSSRLKSHKPLKKIMMIVPIALALVLFLFLFKKPAAQVFCQRQVARKINNFKRIIFKYGIVPIPEEDKHIKSITPALFEACLKSEHVM